MSQESGAASLSDEEFFFGHLSEYLDDELTPSDSERFKSMLGQDGYGAIPELFTQQRGILQLKFGDLILNDKLARSIQNFVRNPEATRTIEDARIHEVERKVASSNLRRGMGLALIVGLLSYILYYVFAPQQKPVFNPLEVLGYEALAMEQDRSNSRLNLPAERHDEIKQFFQNTPGLNFSPLVLAALPKAWQADGASVIDYETAKVSVVQYTNGRAGERIFLFALGGTMDDLPDSDALPNNGLLFQAYASDSMNLVAWQKDPQTLAFLVGRLSVQDLVSLAAAGNR